MQGRGGDSGFGDCRAGVGRVLNVFTMFNDEVTREEGEGFAELGEKLTTDEIADGLFFFVVGVDFNFKLVVLIDVSF